MSGVKWTQQELNRLGAIYNSKKPWVTDYELASQLAGKFKKSSESIRWQLRQLHKEDVSSKPAKILLLDIETLPIEGYAWGVWNQNITSSQIKKDWSIVCWSAKWLYDSKVYGEVMNKKEALARDDKNILGSMWDMINQAHVVITHNGDNFDLKRLNTRFLVNGFPPPMYYKSIDTLKILKDNFSFTFNRMDYVNQVLGIGRKIETSFKWWRECSEGNQKYLNMMLDYNMQDVNILEELYVKIRPWMKGHPNMNVHSILSGKVCPTCGNAALQWNGTYETPLGLYRAFRCQSCGAIGRSTKKAYKINGAEVQ